MRKPYLQLEDNGWLVLTLETGVRKYIGRVIRGILFIRRKVWLTMFHHNRDAYGFCLEAIRNHDLYDFTLVDFWAVTPTRIIHARMRPEAMLDGVDAGYQYSGYERQFYLTIPKIDKLNIAQESLFA